MEIYIRCYLNKIWSQFLMLKSPRTPEKSVQICLGTVFIWLVQLYGKEQVASDPPTF